MSKAEYPTPTGVLQLNHICARDIRHWNCKEEDYTREATLFEKDPKEICTHCGKDNYRENLDKDKITDCFYCALGIRNKAVNKDILKDDVSLKWRWQKLWLKHCLDSYSEINFDILEHYRKANPSRFGQNEIINQAADISRIIRGRFLTDDSHIMNELGREIGIAAINRYKKAIADWFLRRYDWKEAFYTFYLAPGNARKIHQRIYEKIGWLFYLIVPVLLSVLLLPLLLFSIVRDIFPPPSWLTWTSSWAGITSVVTVLVAIISIASIILVTAFIFHDLRFIYLRLVVTVLVTNVSMASLFWSIAARVPAPASYIVPSLALVGAFFYCIRECAGAASLGPWSAFRRALPVILYGLLFALSVNIVFSELMGQAALVGTENLSLSWGWWQIYPKEIIFFAPLSLLLGLFAYKWGEKPVTAPF